MLFRSKRVDAVVVGAGNLGRALSGFAGFRQHGLYIVAAFDADEAKAGSYIHDAPVHPIGRMHETVRQLGVAIAILTVPQATAQDVTNSLVAAGIKAIWNFTNVKLKVPDDVVVQNEDLSSGYAMLTIKRRIKSEMHMGDAI